MLTKLNDNDSTANYETTLNFSAFYSRAKQFLFQSLAISPFSLVQLLKMCDPLVGATLNTNVLSCEQK